MNREPPLPAILKNFVATRSGRIYTINMPNLPFPFNGPFTFGEVTKGTFSPDGIVYDGWTGEKQYTYDDIEGISWQVSRVVEKSEAMAFILKLFMKNGDELKMETRTVIPPTFTKKGAEQAGAKVQESERQWETLKNYLIALCLPGQLKNLHEKIKFDQEHKFAGLPARGTKLTKKRFLKSPLEISLSDLCGVSYKEGEMLVNYRDGEKTPQLSLGYLEFIPNPHLVELVASDPEIRKELGLT